MAVTTQIQGKGQAVFMNGEILKRVQNVDLGADLAVENIEELANAGYVEKLSDLPKISVSIETNDVGSMANLSMLKSGTKLPTSPTAYGVTRDANGVYQQTYSGNDVITMADPTYDLDHQKCPSFVFKISEHNNTTLDRSCHVQGTYLDSVEFSYEVGGLAKENYRFSGDHKVWYFGAKKDIQIDMAAYATTATATTTVSATGHTLEAVFLNKEEVYNLAKSIDTYGITWAGTTLTAATGTPFLSGDRIEVVYHVDTPGAFPKLNSTNTGTRGGLRRGSIKVYAWKHGDTGDKERLLRCQSVSGSLDFGRQEIYELGTQRYIDKPTTYPLNVRFDMTFSQADLKTMAIAQGKHDEYEAGTLTVMDVKDFIDDCDVQVEIYKDSYTATASTLAKTITIANCKVVTEGDTARVGNSAGQWRATLQSDNITWSGSGNNLDL